MAEIPGNLDLEEITVDGRQIVRDEVSGRLIYQATGIPISYERGNYTVIEEEYDLPDSSSGVRTLQSNHIYIVNGSVSTADTLALQDNTILIGESAFASTLEYTGTGDFITATDSNIVIRNLNINLTNGGQALNLTDTLGSELLVEGVRFTNAGNLGIIDGYDSVFFIKNRLINYASGVSFSGALETLYITEGVFESPTATTDSIILDSAFSAENIIFSKIHFKDHDNTSSYAIFVDGGASINSEAIVTECVFTPNVSNKLRNFSSTDIGWNFNDNIGVDDSSSISEVSFDGNTTETTINTQGTWYKVVGFQSGSESLAQRFTYTHDSGNNTETITYDGLSDILGYYLAALSASSGSNNQDVEFSIFRNGALVNSSITPVTLDTAGTVYTATLNKIIPISNNDTVDLRIRNTSSTTNVTVHSVTQTIFDL